ncbi:kielin/chordin-like protein [Ruditapes philippinarum]|uniref:kielin/chordin-like protein n=1 Tax=Ruditapes philippinarum TaxID=129788 RepID=UPI00295BFC15|nr:kielin/chordin-like protein [Ruditapes philippinarum]
MFDRNVSNDLMVTFFIVLGILGNIHCQGYDGRAQNGDSLTPMDVVDCSLVKCAPLPLFPPCLNGVYTPVGSCCPVCRENPVRCPPVENVTANMCQLIKFVPCKTDNDCVGADLCCPNGCGLACQYPVSDCSAVLCLKPDCLVSHVPPGQCCPVCEAECTTKALCPPIKCPFGSYIPEERCCPTCKPDCTSVDCQPILCLQGSFTPDGECCPVCKPVCSLVPCDPLPLFPPCVFGVYTPVGSCCPVCRDKPVKCPHVQNITQEECNLIDFIQCTDVSDCEGANICCPNGCGLMCQRPIPDCSAVSCFVPDCSVTHIPRGECCPVCGPDCTKVFCPLLKCPFGSYTPKRECCPVCRQDCRLVRCLRWCENSTYASEGDCCTSCKLEKPGICPKPTATALSTCVDACWGDHDCTGDQKCCSNGCGRTCQDPATNCTLVECLPIQCKHGSFIPERKCCPYCKPGNIILFIYGFHQKIIVVNILLSLSLSTSPLEKPGKCPPVQNFTENICQLIKFEPCRNDLDCTGPDLCCPNGCGLACQRPVPDCSAVSCLIPDCAVTHVPPGECCPVCGPDCSTVLCPLIKCLFGSYTPEGECCDTCKPDCSQVPCPAIGCLFGSYKPEGNCCPICNKEKPGVCIKPEGFGACVELCSGDHDCTGDQKCCSNGCGHTCQDPGIDCRLVDCQQPIRCLHGSYIPVGECCSVCKPEKPGNCPNVAGMVGICLEACSGDHECLGDQKCCSNGCGHTCQDPASEICPNGQNGTCGSIAGNICPDTTECMFMGSFPDAQGKCCIKEPKPLSACREPLQIGPCRAAIPRYFYNSTSCKCELFSWGGCQPNGNNFFDLEYCQASCEKPNPICALEKIEGYCKTNWNIDRWRYNSTSCKCEPYKWHGCGNANSFISKELCESNCGCHNCEKNTHICDLPIKPDGGGPIVCLAYIPSYGYNTKTCRCEKFIYSGCGGNANRFETLAQCEKRCGNHRCEAPVSCNQPVDEGSCDDQIDRYFFNKQTCECEKFIWTGCGGNSNNFKTLQQCKRSCRKEPCVKPTPNCLLPKEVGPCDAVVKRYYFDKIECQCKMFNYGGCEGNSNNFPTLKKCKQACRKTECPVCNLPADSGPCEAAMRRYFYNTNTCQCEEFIYGGCKGNGNRYETIQECEAMCGSYPCIRDCLQPQKVGPCKAAIKRFYYNPLKNKCEKFIWGGCQPNGNNFESKKFCNKACKKAVCTLPAAIGRCKARIERYYYNSETKQCEVFYWGGCDSNGNNFKTAKACKKRCA